MLHRPRGFEGAPWEMAGSGVSLPVLVRARRGNSAEYEYAKDRFGRPLELTEEDARALVTLLNGLLREARLARADTRRSASSRQSASATSCRRARLRPSCANCHSS